MKPVMNSRVLSAFLLAAALTPVAALGQEAEENRGEQIAAQACTYCHGFNNIALSHKTR